jgi:glycosyltransferase involved in cell wall biosynthesis
MQDPAARSRLGRAAREWASRNLSWDAKAREYERLYQSLLTPPAD